MIYFCRVGFLGHVGRFSAVFGESYQRGDRVVCRTARGVELGEVLAIAETDTMHVDGSILRRCGEEDLLLWRHLSREAEKLLHECRTWIAESRLNDTLLDVEPLLDGRTLYFHFLGEPLADFAEWSQRFADKYEERIRSSRFFQLLEHGCGPGCGTEEKSGCGAKSKGSTGGCAVCVAASACKTGKSASAPNSDPFPTTSAQVAGE